MHARNYYEILQVSTGAEAEIIEAAYRRLAAKYHPDKNPDTSATTLMRELNDAYETLGNPEKRRVYDEDLRAEQWMNIHGERVNEALNQGWTSKQCVEKLVEEGVNADVATKLVDWVVDIRQKDAAARASVGGWPALRYWLERHRHKVVFGIIGVVILGVIFRDALFARRPQVPAEKGDTAEPQVKPLPSPAPQAPAGILMNVGKTRLYYSEGVGQAEAEKLRDYLIRVKADQVTHILQIRRNGVRFELRFLGIRERPKDDATPAYLGIGEEVGSECFDNAPVDVYLCDSQFQTLREYPAPEVVVINQLSASLVTTSASQELNLTCETTTELSEVRITVTLHRQNGVQVAHKLSWKSWKPKEVKRIAVLSNRYVKIEITGTARLEGRKVKIENTANFDWK
ncbi:J domain-containing protein [Zavarzinella formosa]|uniref:J domain-containing protein n=1 Tax=Zavarzinella formosa TaxID=360055 RepID=UPI000303DD1B|nr:J domain-containing protein [Zavarzinella formosa]